MCAEAEGKANFGFVSKYKKGADIPSGNTEFQFKAGKTSTSTRTPTSGWWWLGIRLCTRALGTTNGSGQYGFMLSAIDSALTPGTDVDTFRIKVWDKATDEIVYDNQMDDSEDSEPTTAIGDGNIVIHKAK